MKDAPAHRSLSREKKDAEGMKTCIHACLGGKLGPGNAVHTEACAKRCTLVGTPFQPWLLPAPGMAYPITPLDRDSQNVEVGMARVECYFSALPKQVCLPLTSMVTTEQCPVRRGRARGSGSGEAPWS